jgi:hypothetical protein
MSLVATSEILFLVYGYGEETYRRISFWEVRVPVAALIFVVVFMVLWTRSRPRVHREISTS